MGVMVYEANTAWTGELEEAVFGFGAWWIICGACEGTGVFFLPDDVPMRDVECKGFGLVPVALEGEL